MTQAEMRTAVRDYLDENFAVPVTPYTNPVVDRYVNRAIRFLSQDTGFFATNAIIALVAGTPDYPLPTDYIAGHYIRGSNLTPAIVYPYTVDQSQSEGIDWHDTSQGIPNVWMPRGKRIHLNAAPNGATVTAGITLFYAGQAPDFSDPYTALSAPEHEILALKAAAMLAASVMDSEQMQARAQEFTQAYQFHVAAMRQGILHQGWLDLGDSVRAIQRQGRG